MNRMGLKQCVSLLLSVILLSYHTGFLLLVAAATDDATTISMLDNQTLSDSVPAPNIDPITLPDSSKSTPAELEHWEEVVSKPNIGPDLDATVQQDVFVASGRILPAVGTFRIVNAMTQEPDALTLAYHEEQQLTIVNEDGVAMDPLDVQWSSDNTSVVEIDQMGNLNAVGVGVTTVTASHEAVDTTRSVTVTPLVVELDFSDLKAVDKPYDGTTTAQITGQLKLKQSPLEVTFAEHGVMKGQFASKDVSKRQIEVGLSASGFTLSNPNYIMPATLEYKLTAYINAALLDLKMPNIELPYGSAPPDFEAYKGVGALGEVPQGEWGFNFKLNGNETVVENAGVYDVVTSFTCTDSNYIKMTYVTNSQLIVTPKTIGLAGLRVKDKVYDGSLEAVIEGTPYFDAPVAGDVYISGSPIGAFIDAQAGNSKPINLSGLQLKGAAARNYSLAPTQLRGSIAKRPLELHYSGPLEKVYDKSDRMKLEVGEVTLIGLLPQDQGNIDLTSVEVILESIYPSPSVKVMDIDWVWQSQKGENYEIVAKELTAVITPAPLMITGLTALDREYDGSTTVEVAGGALTGVLPGDQVSLIGSGIGSIPSKQAISHPVTVSGFSLSGTHKDYYFLQTTSPLSVEITPKALLLKDVVIADKVYDGSHTAHVQSAVLSAALPGDEVILQQSDIKAEFLSADAGADKAVRIYPESGLSGRDADNYRLSYEENTVRGRIIKASPVLSLDSKSVQYSGSPITLDCTIRNISDPHLLTDQLYYSYLKQGDTSPSTQAPVDAGVYEVTVHINETVNFHQAISQTALLIITKADIANVQMHDREYLYDGREKSLLIEGDLPSGAIVKYQGNHQTAVGSYNVSAVVEGNNHNPLTLHASLNILRDTPIINLRVNKVYALQGDLITIDAEITNSQTGKYESQLPNDITLLINGGQSVKLQGTNGTYRYQYTAPSMQGKLIFQAISAENQSYFASVSDLVQVSVSNKIPSLIHMQATSQEITYGQGLEVRIEVKAGDQAARGKVSIYHDDLFIKTADLDASGSYSYKPSREVLQAGHLRVKAVYEGDAVVAGSETQTDVTIAPKKLGLTVTAKDKTYDGTSSASVELALTGVISPDQITAIGSAVFDGSTVGKGKTVTISSIELRGITCGNYVVDSVAKAKATIHQKLLTARLMPEDKQYDGTDRAKISTELVGVVAGETVRANTTGYFADAMAGKDKKIQITGIELIGATATNYDVEIKELSVASIVPRELKFADQGIELNYSGFGQDISIATDIEGVELIYSFYKDGREISPPIIFCGDYIVKATPKSSNYSGTATVNLKIIPAKTTSPVTPPTSGDLLPDPVAVIGGDIRFIDLETGHFINRADYSRVEPMLHITEPDDLEYGLLQQAVQTLGEYDQIGFMSLSLMLKLDAKDGSSTDKSVSLDQTILVCMPYPQGLDPHAYTYKLLHVGREGPEIIELRTKEGWLEFSIKDFSPFALAYTKKPEVVDPTDPTDPSNPPAKPGTSLSAGKKDAIDINWQAVYHELTQSKQPVVIHCGGLVDIPAYIIDSLRDTQWVLTLIYQGETIRISGNYLPPYEPQRIYYSIDLLCQKYGAGVVSNDLSQTLKEPTLTKTTHQSTEAYRPTVSYKQEPDIPAYKQAQEVIETAGKVVKNSGLSFMIGIMSGALLTVVAALGLRACARKTRDNG